MNIIALSNFEITHLGINTPPPPPTFLFFFLVFVPRFLLFLSLAKRCLVETSILFSYTYLSLVLSFIGFRSWFVYSPHIFFALHHLQIFYLSCFDPVLHWLRSWLDIYTTVPSSKTRWCKLHPSCLLLFDRFFLHSCSWLVQYPVISVQVFMFKILHLPLLLRSCSTCSVSSDINARLHVQDSSPHFFSLFMISFVLCPAT